MKKMFLVLIILAFSAVLAFGITVGDTNGDTIGDTNGQEEIDFLLFMPNSGNEFVEASQAMLQLDNLSKYLTSGNLIPGQIHVYGYAAIVENDIEATDLSRDRALFVMHELQRRGVSADLFAAPVAFGEVDLWGNNRDEEDRSPNRRVRVVLDGDVLTPAVIQAAPPAEPVKQESKPEEPKSKFPWWIIVIPLLALILFFLLKKRKPAEKPVQEAPPVAAVPVVISYTNVNLEEEIRFRAYELYLWRSGQNGDADTDWHNAVRDVSARYEPSGYQVYYEGRSWWAKRAIV